MTPASLRYNNPGAMYPGPSARKFGSTGFGVIGGGHKIAQFPDPVSGAAAQFDLLARSYAGMPLDRAIHKWSGGNSSGAYVQGIAKDTGLAPDTLITPELLASPQGVALARRMAQHEAGRPFPLNDQQWAEAQRMGLGGAPQTQVAGTSQTLPPVKGDPEPMLPTQRPQPQGYSLMDALTNPLTLAGLSILGDPQRDVGRGLAVGSQVGGQMQERRRQEIGQQAFQQMLQTGGAQGAGAYAPMLAQLGPEKGVPLLMDLMESQRRRTDDAAKWEVEKRLKEAQIAKEQAEARGGRNRYGLNPVMGVDEQGNTVPMQLNSAGGAEPVKLPPGVKFSNKPIQIDAGDKIILIDPYTRQPVGEMSKNVAEVERQKEAGAQRGKAQTNLPMAQAKSKLLIDAIDSVLADPALSTVTGPIQSWLPNVSGPARRAQSKVNQLQGKTFLQAFDDLRGAGAITENEGAKATQAYNRLSELGVDDADYPAALKEFRNEVLFLSDIARMKAGQPPQYYDVEDVLGRIDRGDAPISKTPPSPQKEGPPAVRGGFTGSDLRSKYGLD